MDNTDIFLSTYQKDYVWPNKPPKETREEPGAGAPEPRQCPLCGCQSTVCPPAVAETWLQDQPCKHLRKLRQKYPLLFDVLQQLPPEDQIARLYCERLRTAQFRHDDSQPPCPQPPPAAPAEAGPPPQDTRPRPCLPRRAAAAKQESVKEEEAGGARMDSGEIPSKIVTGRSEYQDGVGATGARIMNEKLLYREENRPK